jgi:hypothetical protein
VTRRIRVEGVRKRELDTEQLALVYWLQAKRLLRERREQEEKAKARKRRVARKREADHEH